MKTEPKESKELKLLIKEENKPVLREIAANMSGSSLTSALNYVLEAAAWSVLEDLKAIKSRRNSSRNIQEAGSGVQNSIMERQASQSSIPERQVYIPELDADSVQSAFD